MGVRHIVASRVDVDAADDLTLGPVDDRVREALPALEVARVPLEIAPVVLRRHRPRPRAPLPPRRAANVLDGRRPGGVILVVVLRPERLEHEQRGLEAARGGELLGNEHSADASNADPYEN